MRFQGSYRMTSCANCWLTFFMNMQHPSTALIESNKLLSSPGFFGNLMWEITRTHIFNAWEISESSPYSVLWQNEYHVVIRIGRRGSFEVGDIHLMAPIVFTCLPVKRIANSFGGLTPING